ncbi:MAG: flagella basal body P-ring formation protein FlgA [Erythrobacter sp.]
MQTDRQNRISRPFAAGLCLSFAATFAAPALAQEPAGAQFTDPAQIDTAVAQFTGAPIGTVGGARTPTDRRLRLASCSSPLLLDWHGRTRATVKVQCADPDGWRIFVATRPAAKATPPRQVVKRGDAVTVMVRGRGFSVQHSGEATESGAIGDWIEVRTARRADPIHGKIERPGLVVIPAQ